jgi:uncharacterized protein (TIGR00297 family)
VSFPLLLAAGLLLNAAAAAAAFWRRTLTPGGAAAAVVVGTLIFCFGGPFFWLVLGAFFLSSTLLGRLGSAEKERLAAVQEKGIRRDSLQVIANGGVAAAMAILSRLTGEPEFAVAFAAALASSNADTWGSEVGILSRRPPVSILSFRPVAPGMSGGVSLLGTGASLAGSLFIAIVFTAVQGIAARTAGGLSAPGGRAGLGSLAVAVAAAGVIGSLVDSVLGASIQAQYAAEGTGAATERRSSGARPNVLVRGFAVVTNDAVNLASSAAAAAAGLLLYRLLG